MRVGFFLVFVLCMLCVTAQARQLGFKREYVGADMKFSYAWQDLKGKTQQLSFRLSQRDIERGIAEFKPLSFDAAGQHAAGVVQKYLNGQSRRGKSVRVVGAHAQGYSLSYVGFTDREFAKIKSKAEGIHKKAFSDYAKQRFYDHYTTPQAETYLPDYRRIAKRYVNAMRPVANAIKRATVNMNQRQKINFVLGFLQSIPYDTLENRYTSNGAGFQTPYGLLVHNRGDCDTKSVAMAAIMRNLFPNLRLVLVHVPGHAFLGMGFHPHQSDLSLKLGGYPFVLAEPVGPSLIPVGQVAHGSRQYLNRRSYSYQEVTR